MTRVVVIKIQYSKKEKSIEILKLLGLIDKINCAKYIVKYIVSNVKVLLIKMEEKNVS